MLNLDFLNSFMKDKYKNFWELAESEREGTDFIIEKIARDSDVAVIAIHGGEIEPGTTEIAREIAGDDFSFYSFIGKKDHNNGALHITSTHFNEPGCLELAGRHKTIVSIHGMRGAIRGVMPGGLDKELKAKIKAQLQGAGFLILPVEHRLSAVNPKNICNRGTSSRGVQIEISRKLRNNILQDKDTLTKFATAIKKSLD